MLTTAATYGGIPLRRDQIVDDLRTVLPVANGSQYIVLAWTKDQ